MDVSDAHPRHSLSPNPSHFRQVQVTTIGNKYIDPVHRRMFLPQWKFSEDYEKLFKEKHVPYHTEDIAYTLPHLLDKVSGRSGLSYTQVFTETGRHLHGFSELPDFLSKVIIGTEDDLPPARTQRRQLPERRPLLVLSTINLSKVIANRNASKQRNQMSIPKLSINLGMNQTQGFLQPMSHSQLNQAKETLKPCDNNGDRDNPGLQASVYSGQIGIIGSSVRPLLTGRGRTQSVMKSVQATIDSSPERSPKAESSQTLVNLFTPKEIESMQREYMHLRHLSLVQETNDAVSTYNRLPGKVRNYLTSIRSKAMVVCKFHMTFATYIQNLIPILRGKPIHVFRALLRGLGSDERGLSWSQWLLLNALLIHNTASETIKIDFICRVTSTQMLSARPAYIDVMLLLTSLFQADSQNAQFQVLFQQLKAMLHESGMSMTMLRRKCLTGQLDYEAILSRFRTTEVHDLF